MQSLEKLFGKRLKYLRKEAKLTQSQLAEASDLSEREIRHLERGDRWPQPETLQALMRGLNVPLKDFFDF